MERLDVIEDISAGLGSVWVMCMSTMLIETKQRSERDVHDSRLFCVDVVLCATAHRHPGQTDASCTEATGKSWFVRCIDLLIHHGKKITMLTDILQVTGMTCGGCVSTIEGALRAVPGVTSAKVSLANHEATVQFSEGQTSREQLQSAIEKAGYGVEQGGRAAAAPAKGGCCG